MVLKNKLKKFLKKSKYVFNPIYDVVNPCHLKNGLSEKAPYWL